MYKITVDLPNLSHGEKVEVDGVGIFDNGTTKNLPDDFDMSAFLAHHHVNTTRYQDHATREVTAPDFSLTTAFDLTPGVTVEEVLSPYERRKLAKEYADQTVDELKKEISDRNDGREEKMLLSGNKQELIDRLKEDDKEPVEPVTEDEN